MASKKERDEQRMVGGRDPSDRLKGGAKKKRDKRRGIADDDFWRWFHRRKKKELGGRNATDEEIDAYHDEWEKLQRKPKVK